MIDGIFDISINSQSIKLYENEIAYKNQKLNKMNWIYTIESLRGVG